MKTVSVVTESWRRKDINSVVLGLTCSTTKQFILNDKVKHLHGSTVRPEKFALSGFCKTKLRYRTL